MKKAVIAIQDYKWSFHILVAGIVLSVVFYMYCVSMAVRNAVARNDALETASALETKVGELETQYIAATDGITMDSAAEMGLREPQNKIFISRMVAHSPLSINR